MSYGSHAPYAKPRNERLMHERMKQSGIFPEFGTSSTDWMNDMLEKIQQGDAGNVARGIRMQQEVRINARLDEEKQLGDLMTARRPQLIGEAGRARSAQRAAQQVFAGI